jgi:hypothetical protein
MIHNIRIETTTSAFGTDTLTQSCCVPQQLGELQGRFS